MDVVGETPTMATETVALPMIRDYLRPFAVAVALPRDWVALGAFCMLLYFHDDELTRSRKNQKTYRRLFGMIFFQRIGRR